jgi:hypothetical protein
MEESISLMGLNIDHELVLKAVGSMMVPLAGWPWIFRIKDYALEPWTPKRQLRQALLASPLMVVCGFNATSDIPIWMRYLVIAVCFVVSCISLYDKMAMDERGRPFLAWSKPAPPRAES